MATLEAAPVAVRPCVDSKGAAIEECEAPGTFMCDCDRESRCACYPDGPPKPEPPSAGRSLTDVINGGGPVFDTRSGWRP